MGNFDNHQWECDLYDAGWRWYRCSLHEIVDDKGVEAYFCLWQPSLEAAQVEAVKAVAVYGTLSFFELDLARGEAWNSTTPARGEVVLMLRVGSEVLRQEKLL